jgi:hypothetical protein
MSGTRDSSLQLSPLGGTEKPRHLYQPGGCVFVQDFHQAPASGFAAQSSQRIQHWEIGFARAILLNALSATDQETFFMRNLSLLKKLVDKSRFADAWLARHKDDLALPCDGPLPPLM